MSVSRGFTLIEILIVIVIIGITIGFALLNFGDFGASRRIQFAAEQLVNTLKLAQQQAILDTSTLGLNINNNSYQILKYQNMVWRPVSDKGIFKVQLFPKNTVIILQTQSKPIPGSPPLVINSSGDITPFTLVFGTGKEDKLLSITGLRNGTLTIDTANSQ
jgi:general secretion pathway protein H